jgi:hypothetical protein
VLNVVGAQHTWSLGVGLLFPPASVITFPIYYKWFLFNSDCVPDRCYSTICRTYRLLDHKEVKIF